MAAYEDLRRAHVEQMFSLVPAALKCLEQSSEQIAELRTAQLRRVLAHAKQRSSWHAHRLRAFDVEHAGVDTLAQIEPMTKADLMANWDAITIDPRLTLDACERHLETLSTPAYLLDEYTVVTTSGSSGVRGVFVFNREEFARAYAAYIRWVRRARVALGSSAAAAGSAIVATVAGNAPVHIGVAFEATFTSDLMKTRQFPVTLPLEEIVAGLNEVQPFLLFGYATMLRRLAAETETGRLRIAPRIVTSGVEPLLPEIREALVAAWNAPIINAYGTTEFGPVGIGCTESDAIHISDDLVVIEPVDDQGRAVAAGESAAKYYATGLWRYSQPLIRYEITDEIVLLDDRCACGSSFQRISAIQGRADDVFIYGDGVVVHPHVFREPLGHASEIIEYRVRQTSTGAELEVVASRDLADRSGLTLCIESNLARLGVASPRVVVRRVDHLERVGVAGKLKRFLPSA